MKDAEFRNRVTLIVQIFISVSVLIVSFIVIMQPDYPDSHAKWAFGTIGLVVGYWLR